MDANRRWFGWIAIALGVVALAVALMGRGFGPPAVAAGLNNSNPPQANAQPGAGSQRGPADAQQNTQPQVNGTRGGQSMPGSNDQRGGNPQANGSQHRQGGPGANARPENGRPGGPDFGLGGWFGLPFRLGGGLSQLGLLALLAVIGVWLLRGRNAGSATASAPAAPAQAPAPETSEPEGESYVDEPRDRD